MNNEPCGICGNCSFGFECMNEWEQKNPGNRMYSCEWCGIYSASKARCNNCEEYKKRTKVFVFGSNLLGIHGAGAALHAARHYGAQRGVGVGRTGNAYAIPTKIRPTRDQRQMPLDVIKAHVEKFLEYASQNKDIDFEVARIGCGLAGYKDEEIAPMFTGAPSNVKLPGGWDER